MTHAVRKISIKSVQIRHIIALRLWDVQRNAFMASIRQIAAEISAYEPVGSCYQYFHKRLTTKYTKYTKRFLKHYTLDIHTGIIAKVDKKAKTHICCP